MHRFILTSAFILQMAVAAHATLEQEIGKAAIKLSEVWKDANPAVFVEQLRLQTSSEQDPPSPFLAYLREKLKDALVAKCILIDLDPKMMKSIWDKQERLEEGYFLPGTKPFVGHIPDLQFVVRGTAIESAQKNAISIFFTVLDSRTSMEKQRYNLNCDAVGGALGYPLKAPITSEISEFLQWKENRLLGDKITDLRVAIDPDKKVSPVYRVGERVTFSLRANQSCYFRVMCTSFGRQVYQIFPNKHCRDNRLESGVTRMIGDDPKLFTFSAGPDEGVEVVWVHAQRQQFTSDTRGDEGSPVAGSPKAAVLSMRNYSAILAGSKGGFLGYSDNFCAIVSTRASKG